MADLQLETSVIRSGRGTHNDLAVTISFDAALEPGQFPVCKKFGPAAQVKSRLRPVRRKLDRQRCHDLSLPLHRAARQPDARQSPGCQKEAQKAQKGAIYSAFVLSCALWPTILYSVLGLISKGRAADQLRTNDSQLLPQQRAHPHPFGEGLQAEFLVGRMRIVVRQREAEHQGVRAKYFFEVRHDGNRAAFAQQHRLVAKSRFERAQTGLSQRARGRDEIRFPAVPALYLQANGRRTNAFQVLPDELFSATGMLVGDEPEGELGACPGGNNRLAPFALIAAGQTIDFNGGACRALFLRREAAFAKQFGYAEKFPVGRG